MNRLQKKCLLASAGFHLLLFVILLVGPAFLSRTPADLPVIDFIPSKLVDAAVMGGGNPNVRPPEPTPTLSKPQPPVQPAPAPAVREPAKAPEPEPPKETETADTRLNPEALEPERKTHKPAISTKLV